jgi:hypothetical protein
MAVEAKRGCGYRKVGGLYLVDEGSGMPCCKMPLALNVCPCCGGGIKQARGWTWIDAGKMFGGAKCEAALPICPAARPELMGRVGLIWIGESFYPRPVDFLNEAATMGISRRMSAVPREYKAGETWVMFAHPKAIMKPRLVEELHVEQEFVGWVITTHDGERVKGEEPFPVHVDALSRALELDAREPLYGPGIIRIARPKGFEKIVRQSDYDAIIREQAAGKPPIGEVDDGKEWRSASLIQFERDASRGVTWVPVPDDDPDHQGTVYDSDSLDEGSKATAS